MTDRTHHAVPGSEEADEDSVGMEGLLWGARYKRNDADTCSPALRTDGGGSQRGLFAVTSDPVLRYDLEDDTPVVTDVNAAYAERLEVDADVTGTLESRLETDLEQVASDEGPARVDDVVELVESAAVAERIRAVVRGTTPSGDRDYLASVLPFPESDDPSNDSEGPGGYVVFTDISAQQERTRDLVEQRDRLDEFASIVSHDLRNPLEVAKIQLEAARNRGDDVHFEKAQDAHVRMEQIIDDVLTLARQGQVIDDVDCVSLSTVAEDAWASVAGPAATLTVETDDVLRADGDRLQELLENLFRNAVEHGSTNPPTNGDEDGDEDVDPEVTVTVERTTAGFAVADDGTGIPEDDRQAVFEDDFSTSSDGTGLGLVIVQRIAEAHGWSVEVGSAEDGGAKFDVSGVEFVD